MAGTFPPQVLEAVGACTRALDGPDDSEAILARADAATLGALRAAGDRLALKRRWHDARIERRFRPADSPAREIFDALELARLDAIGALAFLGIAGNLLSHPGADRDGLRWLAFETFSHRQSPHIKTDLVSAVRASLPTPLAERLAALAANLHEHERFADAAANWSRDAATVLTSAGSAAPGAGTFPWLNPSVEYVLRPQQPD